ncbi:hypothetical protein AT15_00105 [Kosmotoga arenicorallina S304]|uniref:Alpha-2-macroglobulin domain-containing protein n=1 Tax=Kosmotoga arenicorallina S304 TaxID=1453497 RepID=A0A176K3U0_9BACT|nr:MG2 domain-containing protein [Kosmotoga arenicorallina]OAA32515.1 hypothetical protein AT15_00105 [Kosmotoga arenicorallina S304]
MKRITSIVLLILAIATVSFSFEVLNSYGKYLEGIFYEYVPAINKIPMMISPELYEEKISVKVYHLSQENLFGAVRLSDISLPDSPSTETEFTARWGSRIKLSEELLGNFSFVQITTDKMSRKLIYLKKTLSPKAIVSGNKIVLKVWNRVNSRVVNAFEIYNVKSGALLGSTTSGELALSEVVMDELLLIKAGELYYVWRPENLQKSAPPKTIAFVFTDRPAYKAGETIHYRVFLRKVSNEGYELTDIATVTMIILDPLKREFQRDVVTLDDFGAADGKIETNKEITRGSYMIKLEWLEDGNRREYTHYINIADYKKPIFEISVKGKDYYRTGKPITFEVSADYYFGGPVANGEVAYTIYKNGAFVDTGSTRLNNNGFAVVGYSKSIEPGDYSALITVSDESGMELQQMVYFKVIDAPYRYAVQSKIESKVLYLKIKTISVSDEPVSASFNCSVWYKETYYSEEQKKSTSTRFYIFDSVVKTDENGNVNIAIPVKTVPSGKVLYITLDASDFGEPKAFLEEPLIKPSTYVEPPKKLVEIKEIQPVKPGEDCEIIINTAKNLDMWLIADFGGKIITRSFTTNEGSNYLWLKVPEGFGFGSFPITFVTMSKSETITINKTVAIKDFYKDHNITITSEKRYAPGQEATLKIKTTDNNGNPVETSVTLAVISRALLDLFEKGKDTWLETYSSGFKVGPVTYELLNLDYFNDDMYPSISNLIDYTLDYYTAAESKIPLVMELGTRVDMAESKAVEGEALPPSSLEYRKKFSDTALWSILFTDKNGEATVTFTLPDDLDRWTIRALSSTKGGGFSYSTSEFETWKPLTITSFLPEFFISGDEVATNYVITNYTDKPLQLNYLFKQNNEPVAGSFELLSGDSTSLSFRFKVKELYAFAEDEVLTLSFAVYNDEINDAVENSIPIKPRYIYSESRKKFLLTGEMDFVVPENTYGTLIINNSIGRLLFEGIKYLVKYPHGCVEQTMSRVMPLIAAKDLLEYASEDFKNKTNEYLKAGIDKLYGYQHYDGGWGWWKDDLSNNFMTAYVMYGFYHAQNAGVEISRNVLERGISYLSKNRSDPMVNYVYALYSNIFGYTFKISDSQIENFKNASAASKVLLALTFCEMGNTAKASEILNQMIVEYDLDNPKFSSFHHLIDDDIIIALMLEASIKAKLDEKVISDLANKLLERNIGGRWRRTVSTSIATLILNGFTNKLSKDITVTIKGNGIDLQLTPDKPNSLEIRSGSYHITSSEPVWISFSGKSYTPPEKYKPVSKSVKISRILRKIQYIEEGSLKGEPVEPEIFSPYYIKLANIIRLDKTNIGSIKLYPDTTIFGNELTIENSEIVLGEYHLGYYVYGDLLGKTSEDTVIFRLSSTRLLKITIAKREPKLNVGDTIISEIHINTDTPYLIVEDTLPAGSLLMKTGKSNFGNNNKGKFFWYSYLTFTESRYDRVSYYFKYIDYSMLKTEYKLIAPGSYLIPPAMAWGMYDEDKYFGSTEPLIITVEER